MKKLGELFEIGSGGTPSKTHPEYYRGSIPWVKTGDLKTKYLYKVEDYITEEGLKNSAAKLYDVDTVLIAMYGATIGATSILKLAACTNQACAAFRRSEEVLPEYLYYFLKSQKNKFVKAGVGGAQPNISIGYLKNVELDVRPITEQQKIVQILENANNIATKYQCQYQKLDELVKARFVEMFGDFDLTRPQESWVAIKEIGTVVGGATPKTNHDEYWGGSYPWITPAELDADSGYIYDSIRKLTKAGVESCSLQEMPVGTVILSSRAPIGKVAIAGNTFYCNQGFKNIICKEGITPRYLYTVLLLNVEYLNSLGRGATFKEISKGIVESIRIPVPSMELQEQFAAFVEQTDKSKAAIQKALDEAQLLFDSLMQKYFG